MMSTGTHRLLVHVCVCLPPHLPTFVWEAQDPHGRGVDPPPPALTCPLSLCIAWQSGQAARTGSDGGRGRLEAQGP